MINKDMESEFPLYNEEVKIKKDSKYPFVGKS